MKGVSLIKENFICWKRKINFTSEKEADFFKMPVQIVK